MRIQRLVPAFLALTPVHIRGKRKLRVCHTGVVRDGKSRVNFNRNGVPLGSFISKQTTVRVNPTRVKDMY